jgi:hypothetical protein
MNYFLPSLFGATFFQLCTFTLFISSKTLSSQGILGLPIGLLDMGFHLLIFFKLLSSAMRSTWPSQFNLCFLIKPIIFCAGAMPRRTMEGRPRLRWMDDVADLRAMKIKTVDREGGG